MNQFIKLLIMLSIAFIGYHFYQKYQRQTELETATQPVYVDTDTHESPSVPSTSADTHKSEAAFSCDSRQYCSQMNSLAEAKYFVQHCPDTKMDGNHDGEPCERDSRFH